MSRTKTRALFQVVLGALLITVSVAVWAGCSDDSGGSTATDTGADTAATDGDAVDTGVPDTSGVDTAADAQDTQVADTSTDLQDTSNDNGGIDTGGVDTVDGEDIQGDTQTDVVNPDDRWAHCPASADGGDGTWPFALSVEADALFCRRHPEQTALSFEHERKIQLRFLEGAHRLPMTSGTFQFALPACAVTVDGTTLASVGEGTLEATREERSGFDILEVNMTQPMTSASGEDWVMLVDLSFEAYLASGESLPTSYAIGPNDPSVFGSDAFGFFTVTLCRGTTCPDDYMQRAHFNSCIFENATTFRTARVDFEGGFLETEIRIGSSFASTEPAIMWSGNGTLDGTTFDLQDYFSLVYSPYHHHFDMNYAVLFDTPIGSACGIQANNVPGYDQDPGDRIAVDLIDCQFSALESRKLSGWSVVNTRP